MTSAFNLLFSLPEVLQSEIYQYDNTYRIFSTDEFKDEVLSSYLKSNNNLVDRVTNYLNTYIQDGGCVWNNEYGRIDPDDELTRKTINYASTDEFFVVINHINNAAYFKILPKGSTPDNCSFLCNPGNYDGYFLDNDRQDNLSERILDAACMGSTDPIESYTYNRNNYRLVEERISMYFA
jgi:hypothetical protein